MSIVTIVKTYFRYCKYPFEKPVCVKTKRSLCYILLTNDYKILCLNEVVFLKPELETVMRIVIATTMVAAKIETVIRIVLSTAGE